MSAVVGARDHDRGVWISADRLAIRGGVTKRMTDEKIGDAGGLVYGVTGCTRGGQLFESAVVEAIDWGHNTLAIPDMIDAIGRVFDPVWPACPNEGNPPSRDMAFLLTDGRELVEILGDLTYTPAALGEIVAIGSGSGEALGAAFAVQMCGGDILRQVDLAVAAAIELDHWCGGQPIRRLVEPQPVEIVL